MNLFNVNNSDVNFTLYENIVALDIMKRRRDGNKNIDQNFYCIEMQVCTFCSTKAV